MVEQKAVQDHAGLHHGEGLQYGVEGRQTIPLPFRQQPFGVFFDVRALDFAQQQRLAALFKQSTLDNKPNRFRIMILEPRFRLVQVDKP